MERRISGDDPSLISWRRKLAVKFGVESGERESTCLASNVGRAATRPPRGLDLNDHRYWIKSKALYRRAGRNVARQPTRREDLLRRAYAHRAGWSIPIREASSRYNEPSVSQRAVVQERKKKTEEKRQPRGNCCVKRDDDCRGGGRFSDGGRFDRGLRNQSILLENISCSEKSIIPSNTRDIRRVNYMRMFNLLNSWQIDIALLISVKKKKCKINFILFFHSSIFIILRSRINLFIVFF